MNAKNGDLGGVEGEQVKEHLRAARDAAASAARARAQQARDWANSQIDGLQQRVEAQPYRASAVALGIGFIAGLLVMGLVNPPRRRRRLF
jgi:ElaB/YqjD/DUF883 family membrane-anchored ribosome-binding protein